ncbi:short-chain dehydrogenase reductase 2a-like [Cryptomeria japonica]|uniref:short-chain dehydrogenase reductase 2a-like n=1 Tax=Cryptomeria japonica TaxID=3369 RepID=UPI0027DA86CC|nr:short-chain dehydrogenase reductase 2a-like [Cryptomeria japonica]
MQRQNNSSPYESRLEGKVAIITGGARGIGEASTRLFAKHGANVVIADIEDHEGKMVSESLSPAVTYMRCDVSNEEDVAHVVNMTVSKYGRLDIMFNNAGILGEQAKRKSIMDFDAEEFDNVMGVNVKGVCLGMKHAARIMVPRRSGCIISTASVAGVQGGLGPHTYTASKHAIIGLTKNAACELGKYGIRVNSISPFGVATSMLINAWRNYEGEMYEDFDDQEQRIEEFVRSLANLKGQTLRTTDIAEAALYLVSDEAKYVSGHNLVVDGGITSVNNCVGL